jgi:RimJ/RimL family protein N-acetyltransferase
MDDSAGEGREPAVRSLPETLHTPRMLMRPWRAEDATALAPILLANVAHLGPWIPSHVARPASVPALAERLAGFADDFAAGRGFRYALSTLDASRLLGEADLFPRTSERRVPLAQGDRVELGYWLDAAATGCGFATEAMHALVEIASTLPGIDRAEIRCDERNTRSAAVPARLGFTLDRVEDHLQVWSIPL